MNFQVVYLVLICTFNFGHTKSHKCPPIKECPTEKTYNPLYLCTSDQFCGKGYSCCPNGCFKHNICTKIVHDEFSLDCPKDEFCDPDIVVNAELLKCDSHEDCLPKRVCCKDSCSGINICKKRSFRRRNLERGISFRGYLPSKDYCPKNKECADVKTFNEDYRCEDELDCAFGLVCCDHNCYTHKVCTAPTIDNILTNITEIIEETNGTCPKADGCDHDPVEDDTYLCEIDEDCSFGNKCCKHGCYTHNVCLQVQNSSVLPEQPVEDANAMCPDVSSCDIDYNKMYFTCKSTNDCYYGLVCCKTPCSEKSFCIPALGNQTFAQEDTKQNANETDLFLAESHEDTRKEVPDVEDNMDNLICPNLDYCPFEEEDLENYICNEDSDCKSGWRCCTNFCYDKTVCLPGDTKLEEADNSESVQNSEENSKIDMPEDRYDAENEQVNNNEHKSQEDTEETIESSGDDVKGYDDDSETEEDLDKTEEDLDKTEEDDFYVDTEHEKPVSAEDNERNHSYESEDKSLQSNGNNDFEETGSEDTEEQNNKENSYEDIDDRNEDDEENTSNYIDQTSEDLEDEIHNSSNNREVNTEDTEVENDEDVVETQEEVDEDFSKNQSHDYYEYFDKEESKANSNEYDDNSRGNVEDNSVLHSEDTQENDETEIKKEISNEIIDASSEDDRENDNLHSAENDLQKKIYEEETKPKEYSKNESQGKGSSRNKYVKIGGKEYNIEFVLHSLLDAIKTNSRELVDDKDIDEKRA